MSSYILNNQKEKLVLYTLDLINKSTFFRCISIRKQFIEDFKLDEDLSRSISSKIGKIIKELAELDIVRYYTKSRKTCKNLYKGTLFKNLNEKMDENYTIIRMKAKV